eukprot:78491_1
MDRTPFQIAMDPINDVQMNYLSPKRNSDRDTTSDFSDGRMCRYCFCEVEDNYSSCACRTALCRACLQRELCLTEGRQDHTMKCTVCQTQYQIDYLNESTPSFIQRITFSIKETFCCRNIQIQGSRIPSIRERLALALLMSFLALWTSATTYSIVDPGVTTFSGFSAELLVYLFLVFMDWCVGFSMIWFVKLVDTLQLTLPFALLSIHVARAVAVIVIRFILLGSNDVWKCIGCIGMICTSICVIGACSRLHYNTLSVGYRRIQLRNVELLVNGKGPFRLKDVDGSFSRIQRQPQSHSPVLNENEAQQMIQVENDPAPS